MEREALYYTTDDKGRIKCNFFQNYEISMKKPMTQYFSVESLLKHFCPGPML